MNRAIRARVVTAVVTTAVLGISALTAAPPAAADVRTSTVARESAIGSDPLSMPYPLKQWHIHNANTEKCLEVENSSDDNGGQAQQWHCSRYHSTMYWTPVRVGGYDSPWYRLVNENSGKCLEIENSSTGNGGNAQQWDCGSYNMQWRSERATYGWHIINRHSGKCLEIEDSDLRNGAHAQQWTCADIPTMEWNSYYIDTQDPLPSSP